MKETKIGLVRQFGTEQFSMTITLDSLSKPEDIAGAIESLHIGVSGAFNKVLEREEVEKLQLVHASQKREQTSKALEEQIKKEMDAASGAKVQLSKVEKLVKKSNYK